VTAVELGAGPAAEPGLARHVMSARRSGRLRAATGPLPADVFVIAVPTPVALDHSPDLGAVVAAGDAIARYLAPGNLVVLESTCPPGTTRRLADRLAELRPDLVVGGEGRGAVDVAYCPERVLPGRALTELVENDRVVGGLTPRAAARAAALYGAFCRGRIRQTDALTAELVKLAENAHRDVNLAFANELARVAHRYGADPYEVVELANCHPRVQILTPGPGVGGHCVAVDPWFLVAAAPAEARLMRTAREVNDEQPEWVVSRVEEAVEGLRSGAPVQVALLGLAFKADVDDLRASPAVAVARLLASAHPAAVFLAVDPYVVGLPPELAELGNVRPVTLGVALDRAQAIVVLTDHKEFGGAVAEALALDSRPVIDARGLTRLS